MRPRIILSALSYILIAVGLSMIIPLSWALYYGDGSWMVFIKSMSITMATGLLIYFIFPIQAERVKYIEGYLIVTLAWLSMVIFGTLPYLFSGTMTFTDAFFETMSGFTTTGATILIDIEALPEGILMWRSLTQWLGGMGIIVLFVALISQFGVGANKIFGAEAPGPVIEKLTPKISDTAKNLWKFYMLFTFAQIILLFIAGMTFYDSMAHTFSTIATGGFSTKNIGIGYYLDSQIIQLIITLFMFLGGTNFALYYLFWKNKSFKVFVKNEEFRLYFIIIALATILVAFSLYAANTVELEILPITALFQVVSILTTTGYATVDYDLWPSMARNVMFLLLFIGGSIGSTAGGLKIGRLLILFKITLEELTKFIHPRAILNLKINGKAVDNKIATNTLVFFFVYLTIVALGTLVMSSFNLDLQTSLTAVLASLGVIGPGLAGVGPAMNYSEIPETGKYFLSALMLLGRLELFTILLLFYPKSWK